jgi:hypothetical protein
MALIRLKLVIASSGDGFLPPAFPVGGTLFAGGNRVSVLIPPDHIMPCLGWDGNELWHPHEEVVCRVIHGQLDGAGTHKVCHDF